MKQSFQAGVDTLYNRCSSLGSTPTSKTPDAISTSIGNIYTNRYNEGYNNGRNQGQQDVINNPNGFGIVTRSGYSKTSSFSQWPDSGRQDYVYINDYPQYRAITASNIKVGILNSGGHGTDDFGGDDINISVSCNGYDPNTGRVSIWITGNIRAGNYIICVI